MKKIKVIGLILVMMFGMSAYISSCKVPEKIANKSSAQLWGENCSRCHYVPSPADFSDSDWDLEVSHMRMRANLTAAEADKIVEFLKMAN